MSKRHVYRLDIATESGLTADESQRCIRALLKCMLRSYGVRCLSAIAVTTAADDESRVDNINSTIGDASSGDA